MKDYIVYALSHPITHEVRYVGKSERGLSRPRQHGTLSHLNKDHLPVIRWIKKLRAAELDYVIEVVEKCLSRESLVDAERFWIAQFRSWGFALLNLCDGGEGFTGNHTPETKAKISAAGRGRPKSEVTKARMRKPKSPEHRAKIAEAARLREQRKRVSS